MANKNKNQMNKKRKRVFFLTSFGSVTIEATICVTLFMLFIVYVMGYMTLMNKVFGKQILIDHVSKKMSKAMFYIEAADQITNYNDTLKEQKEKIKTLANNSKVSEINLADAIYDNGDIDIKLTYPLRLPIWKHTFLVKERSKIKDWTGRDLCKSGEIVYITKTGSVYHKSKTCKHLTVNIKSEYFENLVFARNDSGGKYHRCEKCVKKKPDNLSKVFVTSDGNKYHTMIDCPGLSRYIIEIDISQIGDKKACSACGG